MQILIFEFILVLFLIVLAIAIILDTDMFACTVMFSVFSFCAVMTYLVFGSPDVAFTEAVIGTMSTVFFAVALKKVNRYCTSTRRSIREFTHRLRENHKLTARDHAHHAQNKKSLAAKAITFFVLMFICAIFCRVSKHLPAIGDPNSVPNTHVADYYIEHSKEDTAANNIVSGTLADYRGFDTMFETSVMFVSGLVVTLILFSGQDKANPLHDARKGRKQHLLEEKKKKEEEANEK